MVSSSSSSSSMLASSSSSMLSVRNRKCFKPSLSSVSKKTTNLASREKTMFKKASELSILCDVELCVIYYNRDGDLVGTWPEDQSKVRDMAERYSKLNDSERRKKSTNLSQFLNKKTDKMTSLDINDKRFSEKLLEMEASLESNLRVFQDNLLRVLQNQTEQPDQNPLVSSAGFFTTDPSLMSGGVSETEQNLSTPSLTQQHQSKVSLFLYNHDNGSFCQLPDSVSTFDPSMSSASLGAQGSFLTSNNFDLPIPMVFPPLMQTQTPPLVHFDDQFADWNQTPYFADPMMFSSCV
ncbi:PREDICTED: agamous-like MADS-box protein AGL53 [Camelina sativa]|uniref:Agamous-like MADS-box protein AGL53 n=1 Tax=Camelina sativa TaxID=90675 RepID=A0ABM0Y4L8_CAMSA|nr:PREDICTED: agamous-like MADS-box protein AGL53 [Camelina sativa]XP_010495400.2 PREDICTED: agamous-like MADS-box protein AGL53 [Camelina sativa]